MSDAGPAREAVDVTVSDVVNYVFCPRRAWLESQNDTTEHEDRVEGTHAHRHVDPEYGAAERMSVTHSTWGLVGAPDVVQSPESPGVVEIVEYKHTSRGRTVRLYDRELVQLAAYRACLEDMGYSVVGQSVWLTRQRRMLRVTDEELHLFDVGDLVAQTRAVLDSSQSPSVLEDDPRCLRCSQAEVCQPSERVLSDSRIVPPVPDGRILYLDSGIASASVSRGRVVLRSATEAPDPEPVPLERVLGVVVFGTPTLSTPLMVALANSGRTVVLCSYAGRVSGYVSGAQRSNGALRERIHRLPSSSRLQIASEIVRCKVKNQAAVLGRWNPEERATAERIRKLSRDIDVVPDMEDTHSDPLSRLMGVEGSAASLYFPAFFSGLPEWTVRHPGRRQRRPAQDPANAALNYMYALLAGRVLMFVLAVGLEPVFGIMHTATRNKDALVLDLMEQFRPTVADSVVNKLFRTGVLAPKDFVYAEGSCAISKTGKRKLIEGFSERLSTTHRYLDYELSWERTIEHQVRMLLKIVDGTLERYSGVYVR